MSGVSAPVDITECKEELQNTTEYKEELQRLEKKGKELKEIKAEYETRLINLQSSAFKLVNYYFVFQGVILTIICSGSETTLKKSDRWFLFTLSILAIVLNTATLIKTGIRYIENQALLDVIYLKRSEVHRHKTLLKAKKYPKPNSDKSERRETEETEKKKSRRKGYTNLAILMIFFLGFAAVVLVGSWKFIGTQKEDGFNLPSNDKCIRLCNGAKCLNICSEY